MENLSIPVARCPKCELDVPVDLLDLSLDEAPEEFGDVQLTLVFCSVCDAVLNNESNIKISYYDLEQLAALGWERVEDGG